MSSRNNRFMEDFKLACISDDTLSDDQVWILMQDVVLGSEDDIHELVEILHKYRPKLLAKIGFKRLEEEQPRKAEIILHHDDPPCTARLQNGFCTVCWFVPDMQSTCFYFYCPDCKVKLDKMTCPECKETFRRD